MKVKLTDKQVRDYMEKYDESNYHNAMIALEKQYLLDLKVESKAAKKVAKDKSIDINITKSYK